MYETEPAAPRRATGLSLVAIVLLSAAFIAVLALHLLRSDLDPVRDVMSGYANGRWGGLMTFAFYALGIGSAVLGIRITRSTTRTWAPIAVSVLLCAAGVGLVLAGVFEVERPGIPDTIEETFHSDGAIAGFVLIVAAMVIFPYVCYSDPRWRRRFRPALTLALLAVIAAGFSPVAPSTSIAGLAQRVLAVVVFGWVFLVAAWMRFGSAAPGTQASPSG